MNEEQNIQEVKVNSKNKKNFLVVLIVIILISGALYGQYFSMQKIEKAERKAENSASAIGHLKRTSDQLQDALQDLQVEVQKSNLAENQTWEPIIIEHLVRMADLTLNTNGDVKEALLFLLAARDYAKGPGFLAINHALNKDIASLQVVPAVDLTRLVLKIEALSKKIGGLPMVTKRFTSSEKNGSEEAEKSAAKNLWLRFLVSTKGALKGVLEVRRRNVEPLLSPDQEAILRLNVQTKLSLAQLAIMERQDELYKSCLEETEKLIDRYFSFNNEAVSNIVSYMQNLKKVNLHPKLPTLTNSTAAVLNFMKSNQAKGFKQKPIKPKIQQTEGVVAI